MQDRVHYAERNATEILFAVAAVVVFYLIARLVNARPVVALMFAVMPLALAMAFKGVTFGGLFRGVL